MEAGTDLARDLPVATVDREDAGLAHGGAYLIDRAVHDLVDPEVRRGVERGNTGDATVSVELQVARLGGIDAAVLLVRALAGLELLRDRHLVAGEDDALLLLHFRTARDAGRAI
jgi:hypothetical protein